MPCLPRRRRRLRPRKLLNFCATSALIFVHDAGCRAMALRVDDAKP